ncbi:MAG: 5-(carboxyamino)imidazole ribonucleotide synthase [Jaaginema sp. PMC 1079.18]|nr:5-(carboxyamino)imidazole ribonucleotide synthase [Jaaginema sp. PMC 1080.18]MEC4849921.1 5-(carboxyamino)imidazole ribonucleotide synthase [Jaaginema sp. PMC 1079.18]MEC4864893.1 5-(carboxyamino)imidazole ribonucleotide synthase [Jaaginema sp. PMC 1078.18]
MVVKQIGVIGGGQLAWMMAKVAPKLDLKLIVQTPSSLDPAVGVADDAILAAIEDEVATAQLATRCDAITFENEFVDLEKLRYLEAKQVRFRPRLDAIAPLLDKYQQRHYLRQLGIPVPEFRLLETPADFENLTFPLVLKARRHGYDGQGTFILKSENELKQLWERLECPSMLVEAFVPFSQELAVMAARSPQGDMAFYPVVETQQKQQVCCRVIAPAFVENIVTAQIQAIARTILENLEVIGIFGIEFFLTADNKVLVNEIAPRTHNSGHYSLDACDISQFEMQLRAVADLPVISPQLHCPQAVMVNLLGYETAERDYVKQRERIAALPQTFVHWYGKSQARPGRKLGHVTTLLPQRDRDQANAIAAQIENLWYS